MTTMKPPETVHALQSRRQFLNTVAGLGFSAAGIALLDGCTGKPATAPGEETLETTTIRIEKLAAICLAPQYLAENILKSEGFTDVQYIDTPLGEISAAA